MFVYESCSKEGEQGWLGQSHSADLALPCGLAKKHGPRCPGPCIRVSSHAHRSESATFNHTHAQNMTPPHPALPPFGVVFDIDGVLLKGETLIPGAREAVEQVRRGTQCVSSDGIHTPSQ